MTIAGSLEIDFYTNLARLQGELTEVKRAIGQTMGSAISDHNTLVRSSDTLVKQMEREAATFGKTAQQIREMDVAAKALALDERNLTVEADRLRAANTALNQVHMAGTGAVGEVTKAVGLNRNQMVIAQSAVIRFTDAVIAGQSPLRAFALEAHKGAEIMSAGDAGFAGGLLKIAGLAAGAGAALAVGGVAFERWHKQVSDTAGLQAYADQLGLTQKQVESLGGATVTTGDLLKGIWKTVKDDLASAFNGKRLINYLFAPTDAQQLAGFVASIYGAFVGAYRTILDTWRDFPRALGDLFIQAVNAALAGVQWLVNKVVDGVNAIGGHLGHVDLGSLTNRFAGSAASIHDSFVSQVTKATAQGEAALKHFAASSAANAVQIARDRLKAGATPSRSGAADADNDNDAFDLATAKMRVEFDQAKKLNALLDQIDKHSMWKVDLGSTIKDLTETFKEDDAHALAPFLDALDKARDLTDRVRDAAGGIAEAWGTVGRSIGDAMNIVADSGERQKQIAADVAAHKKTDAEGAQATADLQLNSLMGLASATEGLFKKHSAGAKAAEAAEKALAAVQLARTAIDVASGAAMMFSTSGPGGFPQVAAMLAVMASLGFHGGGGSGSAPVTNEGKGTTLGDSDHASDSIKNAIAALGDIDEATMAYSSQMASSLKSIDSHIGNLASLLVKTGSLDASTNVQTGFQTSGVGSAASAVLEPLKSLPVIGSIAGAIGGVIKSLFGTKTAVLGNGISAGPQTVQSILGSGFDASTYTDIEKTKKFLGVTTSQKTSTQYGNLDDSVQQQFGLILKSFDDAIAAAAGPLGQSTDAIQSKLGTFVVDLGKVDFKGLTGDQIQEKLENVFGAAADKMADAAFPGIAKFQAVGEGAFQTLVRVASTVEAVTTDLTSLGRATSDLSVDAKMGVAGMFDSVDAMNSATSTYFQDFYSDAEQTAVKAQQLGAAFTSLGVQMPDSIASYRALVDAQDLSTTAGQQMYATLLKLAPAFADVATAGKAATNAAAILRERDDLQSKINDLLGDTAAQRALELSKLDPSNRAMQERIYALQDEATATQAATAAAEAAAQAQAAIQQERDGLEQQLLQAQGDTVAIRAAELAKLDESNRAIQLQIWALGDQAAATTAAAQAASDAAASEAAIAQQRAGIQGQLQGNTVAIRAAELAQLDPTNRALQQQVYALQDQQTAAAAAAQQAEAAQQASEAAAQAADQLRQAWSSIADDILAEVKRIRGLTSTGSDTFASLQSQFNAATSSARSGDQDAAKSLPGLSQAMLDAAANVATSSQELTRVQAQTAASLEATYKLVSLSTGTATASGFSGLSPASNDNAAPDWSAILASLPSSSGSDNKEELEAVRKEVADLKAELVNVLTQMIVPIADTRDVLTRAEKLGQGDGLAVTTAAEREAA